MIIKLILFWETDYIVAPINKLRGVHSTDWIIPFYFNVYQINHNEPIVVIESSCMSSKGFIQLDKRSIAIQNATRAQI